jgi:hypothetical protein
MDVRKDSDRGPDDRLADQTGDGTDQTRRDALLRLGKYTAPAMLAMLLSDRAVAAS